jgi:hypothetical protein
MEPDSFNPGTISERAAERILARAAGLDAEQHGNVPVARLREAAAEAGIAPHAFDAALSELAGAPTARGGAPWWVRVCLFGVVDRPVAMVFYWLFVAASILAPALLLVLPTRLGTAHRLTLVASLAGFATFSLWSTARAVRWADRHGWDELP